MEENTNEHAEPAHEDSGSRSSSGSVWRNYGYYIFFFSVFIMYELVLRISTVKQISSVGFLFSVMFNLILAYLIFFATTFVSKKARVIVNNTALSIAGAFYISQIIYHNVFGTYYNPESMSNAGQILQFWPTILASAWAKIIYILFCILPIPLYNLYIRKTTIASVEMKLKRLPRIEAAWQRRRRRNRLLTAVCLYIVMLLAFVPFAVNSTTSYAVFFGQNSYEDSIQRTGLLSTLHIDLLKVFLTEDASGSLVVMEDPRDSLPGGTASDQTGNGGTSDETPDSGNPGEHTGGSGQDEPTPPAPIEYGYNVMDIDFESLIAGERENAIISLHEYFAYAKPTRQNQYTGMFEGYNLIMFTAESFSPYAIHPELTPTLYKLVHEGFYFTDFYTPEWGVSTSDGEYVACVGLLPKSNVWSFSRSSNNYLPFVMGNQLKSLGYQTVAYHNHTHTYYHRHQSHPNMGYIYKGVGNGLTLPRIRWPNSDLEMMEATIDEYINNEPFHAYYMTVSGHLEYNFGGNAMASRNRAAVADLPLSDACKAYLATQIELDKALEYLLERLNEAGIAERTAIVISSDHHPYGLPGDNGTDGISEFLGHTVDRNFEIYKNHLVIYAQGMEPVVVDKPASSLDIIPTISNLLGLTYDSRLLAGRDILCDEEGLVVFKNRSFISSSGRYINGGEFVPNPGVEVDENYRRFMSNRIDNMFTISVRILDNDYYRKVFW